MFDKGKYGDGDIPIAEVEKARPHMGLVDAGHTLLSCFACETPLVDIWLTKPDIPITLDIVAHCGVCGDKSGRVSVKGGFHTAPAYVNQQGKLDENGKNYVTIDSYDTEDDLIIIKTRKNG